MTLGRFRLFHAFVFASLFALTAGCGRDLAGTDPPSSGTLDAQLRALLGRWGAVPIGPVARQDPALVDLGRALMFDKLLSGNRDMACASCHQPGANGADGRSLAIGTGGRGFLSRNAPSLLNVGLGAFYVFWDGRLSGFGPGRFETTVDPSLPGQLSSLLAAQAMLPVLNRGEMRGEPGDLDRFGNPNELAQFADSQSVEIWRALMLRLVAVPEYVAKFNAAFPGTSTDRLGFEHAATAIAAFEVEAFTRANSPFDRYLARDNGALSAQAKRGAILFFGEARCAFCHSGPLLGGNEFANIGVPQLGPGTGRGAPLDLGRGELFDFAPYRFAFRVPSLRNVELTAPYMHNGAYATLDAVVRHYNDVRKALGSYDVSQLEPALRSSYHGDEATINAILGTLDFRVQSPLRLTEEQMRDLVVFLKSLTDPAARDLGGLVPLSVPSGL